MITTTSGFTTQTQHTSHSEAYIVSGSIPFNMGFDSFFDGTHRDENPFFGEEAQDWDTGWSACMLMHCSGVRGGIT
jgi:hypothetical protein